MIKKKQNNRQSSLNILFIAGVKPYQQKQNEEYMNKDQVLHFKRILETWYAKLKGEVERNAIYMKDKSSNFPDPIDRASQEEEFNIELRNRDRELKLIKKIEETLNKIKTNNFGFCELCGVEIGIRRLEAEPTAYLCIDCKTISEIKEKQKINYL